MSNKLTTISPSYHSFVEDQVLTHTQLNELIEYFEDQDRLTRICLSGVGLVCGFEVSINPGKTAITITNGAGVTTDGDLIHLQIPDVDGKYFLDIDSVTFTHFGVFEDDKVKYSPQFWNGETQLDIWELFPTHLADGKDELVDFDGPDGLDSMVVVLYLESYTNDPGACTSVSCENQGAEEVRKLRVLLIHEDDMAHLNAEDTMFNSSDILGTYLALQNADVERVTMNGVNSTKLDLLSSEYFQSISTTSTVANLGDGINLMLTKLGMTSLNTSIQDGLTAAFKYSVLKGLLFQYRYDLLKDVVDTYNELKELFLVHYGICCPDIHAFPKHLLLGKVNGTELEEENNPNRHSFYKSPILDPDYKERDRFLILAKRLDEQLKYYMDAESPAQVIITPSNLRVPLGKRAIPFYYLNNTSLVKDWDYDRRKYGKYLEIFGYRQSLSSSNPVVQNPFGYSIDAFDFFRIEGIQGMQYKDALEQVVALRDEFSLPFDVKVLGITVSEDETIDVNDYACEFEDLSVLMTAWTSEQECVLGEVTYLLSGFSTADEGNNIRQDEVLQFKEYRKLGGTTSSQLIKYNNDYLYTAKTGPVYSESTASNAKTGATAAANESKTTASDSLVLENMATESDTLGKVVYDAIEAAPSNESSIVIAYIEQALAQIDFQAWTPVVVSSTISLPAKILAACYAIEAVLPDSIEGLSGTTLTSYTTEIDKLCSYTKQLQAKYKEYAYGEYTAGAGDNTIIDQKILGMMDLLNSQLTNICCGAKKIQTLLQEIDDRKAEILARLKFSAFVEEHPGLEHKAGVEPGGTFIMVHSVGLDATGKVQQGTVVADFALPYLCCSDCAPINFIIPKTPVSLSLSSDYYCLSDTDTPLEFTVSPADGTIETEEPIDGVTVSGTMLYIDSALFPAEMIGVPIKFTVNAQYTDCTLLVRKKPTVGMNITKSAEVPFQYFFEPTGEITGASFEWNFGDGSPIDTSAFATHTYSIPLASGENSVTVTLTVIPGSGTCPAIVEDIILFDVVTVAIETNDVCITDEPVPFTILPVGANPVITGIGVTSDMKFFDPGLTVGQTGPFDLTYDGNVFASMNVHTAPPSNFIITLGTDSFFMEITDLADIEKFQWRISDPTGVVIKTIDNDPKPEILFADLTGYKYVTVQLVTSNKCGETVSEQTVPIPVNGTVSIIPDTFCADDDNSYDFIIEGYPEPPKIEGSGVVSGRFTPSLAVIGDNDIYANGELALTIPVLAPPSPVFNVVAGTDSFSFSADFTNVDTFAWTFIGEDGSELIPPITDDQSPVVPYTSFGQATRVTVQLIMKSFCGEYSSSQILDIPQGLATTDNGTVGIKPADFCVNDTKSYPFNIQGYTTPPTITGPGVDVELNTFTPSRAGVGTHTINVSDGSTVIITVHPAPTGDIEGGISENGILTVSAANISGANKLIWVLTNNKGEQIQIPDRTILSDISVDTLEIKTDRDPNYVTVSLILEGDPCTALIQKDFDLTGGSTPIVSPGIILDGGTTGITFGGGSVSDFLVTTVNG